MGWSLVDFNAMAWSDGAHPLEHKKNANGHVNLLQFEPGFSDPNWCDRAHVFLGVQGSLHIEFKDGSVIELQAGSTVCIGAGTSHRASVRSGQAATVFAVSDLTLDPQPESAKRK